MTQTKVRMYVRTYICMYVYNDGVGGGGGPRDAAGN